MTKLRSGDIDIDFGDRTKIMSIIKHTPAAMRQVTPIKRHNTGVYVTDIPYDPINKMATIDYAEAEELGYIKLDLLNVYVYQYIRDELHLVEMMRDPDWSLLNDPIAVSKLVHVNNYYNVMSRLPEKIDCIDKMAMFLAIIRPGKKELIGKKWSDIEKTVWDTGSDGYAFKRAHAYAYSTLVMVHMNLLKDHYMINNNYDLGQLSD